MAVKLYCGGQGSVLRDSRYTPGGPGGSFAAPNGSSIPGTLKASLPQSVPQEAFEWNRYS